MSERCPRVVLAKEVTLTIDGVTEHWDYLESVCQRVRGHSGDHLFGNWRAPDGSYPLAAPPNEGGGSK